MMEESQSWKIMAAITNDLGVDLNICVLDDEPLIVDLFSEYFKKIKVSSYFTTTKYEEFVNYVFETKPDLAFVDMKLSGNVDGIFVIRSCRALSRSTKFIAITGHREYKQQLNALNIQFGGCISYLEKPFGIEQLSDQIHAFLALKTLYKEVV